MAAPPLPGPDQPLHYTIDGSVPTRRDPRYRGPISIATDPVNLWNKYVGIYENPFETGRSWERQADVQYLRRHLPPVRTAPRSFPRHRARADSLPGEGPGLALTSAPARTRNASSLPLWPKTTAQEAEANPPIRTVELRLARARRRKRPRFSVF